jgi:hypothetical protein
MAVQVPNRPDAAGIAALVDDVLGQATLSEKVGMMSGKGFFRAFAEDGKLWGARPYRAGLDIENTEPLVWGAKLEAAVEAGQVELAVIETACRRILTTLYSFTLAEAPLTAVIRL